MHLKVLAAALLLAAPALLQAEDTTKTPPAPAPKVKKICRYTPPPTGSNRPGMRKCKTEEEWRAIDHTTGDYDGGTNGAPAQTKDSN